MRKGLFFSPRFGEAGKQEGSTVVSPPVIDAEKAEKAEKKEVVKKEAKPVKEEPKGKGK